MYPNLQQFLNYVNAYRLDSYAFKQSRVSFFSQSTKMRGGEYSFKDYGFAKFSFNFLCLTVMFSTGHVHLNIFESECLMLTFKTICSLGHTFHKVKQFKKSRNMLVWPSCKDLHTCTVI